MPAGVDGVEGEQVCGGKVFDVDVIADARAVRRGMVVAEDLRFSRRPAATCSAIGIR